MLKTAGVSLKPMRLESTFLLWVDCSGCCKTDAEVVDLFENRCHIYGSTRFALSIRQTVYPLEYRRARSVIVRAAERLIRALSQSC